VIFIVAKWANTRTVGDWITTEEVRQNFCTSGLTLISCWWA